MSKSITIQFPIKDVSPLIELFNNKLNRRKKIIEKLPVHIAMRYAESRLGKRIDSFSDLRYTIRKTRESLRAVGKDKLKEKLVTYGNNGRWAVCQIEALNRKLYENKQPDDSNFGEWLSVELECILPEGRFDDNGRPKGKSVNEFISFLKQSGYAKYVAIKDDGSVRPHAAFAKENPRAIGAEIVVTFHKDRNQILFDVCTALTKIGATVNTTCGTHVHFDMRQVTHAKTVTTAARRIAHVVPALKQMLPQSRRNNQFCQSSINDLKGRTRHGRYAFVNLQSFSKHRTLEIRGHSGTLDPNKIWNWINLLSLIMKTRNKQEINNIPELLANFRLPTSLSNYVVKRYLKFNPQNATPIHAGIDDVNEDDSDRA